MATISGSVLVLYSTVLESAIDNPASQLSLASLLSIPAAIMIARIIIPETELISFEKPKLASFRRDSAMDAIISGTEDGIKMVLSIVGIIMVLFSLVYFVDTILGAIYEGLSIKLMFSYLFRPLMWLIGIDWSETLEASSLFGDKVVLNEFVAYLNMAKLDPEVLSARTKTILSFALCGFANFASVGIIIGGLKIFMPEEKKSLVINLVSRALISGNLATLTTAAVCSFFI